MIRTVDELVAPMRLDALMPQQSSPRFVHIAGPKKKFDGLFGWSDLNHILDEYEFDHPRLRLVRNGDTIPRAKYSMTDPFTTVSSVDPSKVMEHLSAGATLVVNMIERMTPSLWNLTLAIERELCSRVFITAYAGWRSSNGFALHYDNDDTFILQIQGRKHWTVYEPTRPFPIWNDVGNGLRPETAPVWDGLVNPGDCLFVPRGWWHLAAPVNEPCMHLTLGLLRLKGVDLLTWLFEQLKAQPEIRNTLPQSSDGVAQAVWARTIRNLILAAFDDDLVTRFVNAREANCPIRAPYRFPELEDASSDHDQIPETAGVRLVGRRLKVTRDAGNNTTITVETGGIRITCERALLTAIQTLNDGVTHSLLELLFGLDGAAGIAEPLSAVLRQLHKAGAVVITPTTPLAATI